MFCPKCGTFCADDANFCEGCGVLLPKVQPQAQVQAQAKPKPKPKRNKALFIVLGVVLAFAAVVLVGVVAYLAALPSSETSSEVFSTETSASDETLYECEYFALRVPASWGGDWTCEQTVLETRASMVDNAGNPMSDYRYTFENTESGDGFSVYLYNFDIPSRPSSSILLSDESDSVIWAIPEGIGEDDLGVVVASFTVSGDNGATSNTASTSTSTYANSRYGFSADIPASFKAGAAVGLRLCRCLEIPLIPHCIGQRFVVHCKRL